MGWLDLDLLSFQAFLIFQFVYLFIFFIHVYIIFFIYFRTVRMLRYDPTKAEHTKFIKEMTSKKENIIDNGIFSDDELDTKTRTLGSKSKTKTETINNEIDITVPVSKEKFYKVADSLKESLKQGEQNTFSIRELFSKSDEGKLLLIHRQKILVMLNIDKTI